MNRRVSKKVRVALLIVVGILFLSCPSYTYCYLIESNIITSIDDNNSAKILPGDSLKAMMKVVLYVAFCMMITVCLFVTWLIPFGSLFIWVNRDSGLFQFFQ